MDALSSVRALMKLNSVSTRSWISFLYYRVTVIILVTLSILLTYPGLLTKPFSCYSGSTLPLNVIETHCWIVSLYTFPGKDQDSDLLSASSNQNHNSENVKKHTYYKYVPLLLLFQALVFYMPRVLWKQLERGLMRDLTTGLGDNLLSEDSKKNGIQLIRYYITNQSGNSKWYFTSFLVCELLNLGVVTTMIILTDSTIDNEFTAYLMHILGLRESKYGDYDKTMAAVFPTHGRCTFEKTGVSGKIERQDALCFLPNNEFNQKIVFNLLFYYTCLAISSILFVTYTILTVLSRQTQYSRLLKKASCSSEEQLQNLFQKLQWADLFLLSQIANNVRLDVLTELIQELASEQNDCVLVTSNHTNPFLDSSTSSNPISEFQNCLPPLNSPAAESSNTCRRLVNRSRPSNLPNSELGINNTNDSAC